MPKKKPGSRTILVTDAAGKTGQAIVRALVRGGQKVRALVYRREQIERLEELGARAVIAGDARDRQTIDRAVAGARAIYHIAPTCIRRK